jgi:hypothetical protein
VPRDVTAAVDTDRSRDAGGAGPFTVERRDDVAVIVLDVPGQSMNTLRTEFVADLDGLLDDLEADRDVRGIVLASGKPDSFLAGADIEMLAGVRTAAEGVALAREGQRAFDRIEGCTTPVVVAVHGTCVGWSWPWHAMAVSPPMTRQPASVSPRSCWVCCPEAAGRSACHGWSGSSRHSS